MGKLSEAPAVTGISGIVIISDNFDAQCEFYGHTLGLIALESGVGYAFFQAGEQRLGIFAKGHHPEGDLRLHGADHGISHLEFAFAPDRFASMTARLRERSAHAYGDNFQDRDGNLFHFVSGESS